MSFRRLLDRMPEMLEMLSNFPDIIISETVTDEQERFDETPYKIRGCVLTSLERLDDEFIKLLKECDPHSNEYVERYFLCSLPLTFKESI